MAWAAIAVAPLNICLRSRDVKRGNLVCKCRLCSQVKPLTIQNNVFFAARRQKDHTQGGGDAKSSCHDQIQSALFLLINWHGQLFAQRHHERLHTLTQATCHGCVFFDLAQNGHGAVGVTAL